LNFKPSKLLRNGTSTILSFRKREVLRGGVPQRKPASIGFKE
jgi:hypothetical protein